MTIQSWLKQTQSLLNEAGVGTARLDCLVLLEDETSKERGWLLAHPEYELTVARLKKLEKLIARRLTHEPLAYLRNKTEFYGREFYIDHRVLEPRPESETMIELLKDMELLATPTFIDIGTGSGMLAITAKLEFPHATVLATDIDQGCIDVALQNAKTYNTEITFLKTSLLENLEDKTLSDSIILANLPYVPDSFQINPAAMAEPRIAIFGGSDGLEIYRTLFSQAQALPQKLRYILTESMPPQHEELARIAQDAGFSLEKRDDFIQLFGSTV